MFQVVDCRFYEKVHGTGKRKPAMEGMYARYVKRVLDFSLALISLLLFWWVLVIVAVLVRVNSLGRVETKRFSCSISFAA